MVFLRESFKETLVEHGRAVSEEDTLLSALAEDVCQEIGHDWAYCHDGEKIICLCERCGKDRLS